MKVTFVERQYVNKVFPQVQLKQFAQQIAWFCKLSITDLCILIHRKDNDLETNTICTVEDLMNIYESDKTISWFSFHCSFYIIKFKPQLYSNALNISYNIKGDIENARHVVSLTENTLELTRLSEERTGDLTLDDSQSIWQPLSIDNEFSLPSIEPSVKGMSIRVGGCLINEETNKLKFFEIEESLFNLMKQVYEREAENSVGSFNNYFNQVIKSRCQEKARERG